jgi:glucokinase
MIVGIDVGATTISGGLVSEQGEVRVAVRAPTRGLGPGRAVQTLVGVVTDLTGQARRRGLALDGIGLGLPGLVDVDRGMMVSPHPLVGEFTGVPLADQVRAATGLPVFVDNDANALVLGEWLFGVGRGARSLALLAVGTGVGGGLVLDGTLVRGPSGSAGEFGHVPIDFEGPRCPCGGHGCLNLYTAGDSLERMARASLERGEESRLLALAGGDPGAISSRLVFEAAFLGDAVARGLVDRACRALGAGLGVILNSLDPEVVVITGGVAASLARLEAAIAGHTRRYALDPARVETRLRIVPADKSGTMRGGAALALYELRRRPAAPAGTPGRPAGQAPAVPRPARG